MNDLISKLGIDWKLLAAQVFNFFILLFLLRKFVYKPVLDMLNKRKNIISRSIKEAKKIEENKEREARQARIKAMEIVDSATKLAEDQKTKILEKAKADSDKVVLEAKNIIRMQKDQMAKDLEKETGELALGIVEKYFKSGVKKSDHEKIIRNITAEI
jgi:F-type H+-transporting ATPase subunit b